MRSPGRTPSPSASSEQLLRARAQRYARVEAEASRVLSTVISFVRGGSRYAAVLAELCEIRPLARWCALPGARRAVPGVTHYRGELLTLVDLAGLIIDDGALPAPRWILVSEQGRERLGIMADDVLEVVELVAGDVHVLPLTLGEAGELFRGTTAEGVLVVDTPHLFRAHQLAGR